MFRWILGQIESFGREVAAHFAATGAMKGLIKDQHVALQASFFHTLSNDDEAAFETIKGRMKTKLIADGATQKMADARIKEFEEYMLGLEDWQALAYRLTVVTQTPEEKQLEILERMFDDPSPNAGERNQARDLIIDNIIGDEPLMHKACERLKSYARKDAKKHARWLLKKAAESATATKKFATKTAPQAIARVARATDKALETHIAPVVDRTLDRADSKIGEWETRYKKGF